MDDDVRERARSATARKPEEKNKKTNRKNCNLFEIYDEKMNTVAFLNILIIRPESLRRESRRAFFRHRRLPLEPVARQSRAETGDHRPNSSQDFSPILTAFYFWPFYIFFIFGEFVE